MGLISRRQKMPTNAAGILDQSQAHLLGMQDTGLGLESPGHFNYVLLVPLISESLDQDQNPADVVMSDSNPILDYLGPGGIFALTKLVGMCVIQAKQNGLDAADFRVLLA